MFDMKYGRLALTTGKPEKLKSNKELEISVKHTGCIHMDPGTVTTAHGPSGKSIDAEDQHVEIDRLAGQVEEKMIAWRHDLHRHPELPNRETRTAKIIADHLTSLGLDEVRTGVGVNGIVAVLKGGTPGDNVIAGAANYGSYRGYGRRFRRGWTKASVDRGIVLQNSEIADLYISDI